MILNEKDVRFYRKQFELYGAEFLKILDKQGKNVPLVLNEAQKYVHNRLETQLKETGKVRALVLKGRQQGISTYIGGRFYHKTTMWAGQHAFIITHEQKATDNLFTMVNRYHDNNALAPSTSLSNAKELVFDSLDGGYKLATAGSKDVGRSNTAQLLHASEFGFWQNADTHQAGIGNTIADMDGTEIIYESTANGVGNTFHAMWQQAEQGDSEYIAIFVPWFWQREYRAKVPKDFMLSDEDVAYQRAYSLDIEQMAWRRNKINNYRKGFQWLFDQEYPASPALAFRSSTMNPLISPVDVDAAVASRYNDRSAPLIIGVDPAGGEIGGDRTAIVFRRGRLVFRTETYDDKKNMEVVGIVGKIIKDYSPAAVFIDRGGIGSGIYDRLRELGHGNVFGILFGEGAAEDDVYANRRAEMWCRMRDWFDEQPCRIPNDAALISDISAPSHGLNSTGKILLERKDKMKARGIRSPDLGDALALTFADFVPTEYTGDLRGDRKTQGAASNAGY